MIVAHCKLNLQVKAILVPWPLELAGITDACHHAQLSYVFLVEMGFCYVGQPVSNSWPQVICLLQPPKELGLQAWAPCLEEIILLI